MDSNMIKCKCGKNFNSFELEQHFKNCKDLKNYFLYFDKETNKLIKNYSQQKENLLLIKFLFEQYNLLIDEKIKNI